MLQQHVAVGVLYIGCGALGLLLNAATCLMIATKRAYRLSAYTIMANVALADCVMLIVAGIACGGALLSAPVPPFNASAFGAEEGTEVSALMAAVPMPNAMEAAIAFAEIASWTSGVISYGYLGINRCVAIRFYGTRAKQLNQVWVALVASALSWALGAGLASLGAWPSPLVSVLPQMWTVGMRERGEQRRERLLTAISLAILAISVAIQWVCSTLVLAKIWQVRRKIQRNKLGPDSAHRFRKQARLTFQFFYPSLFCTASSALHFLKPYVHRHFGLGPAALIALHLVWLLNHACNPVIYAYINERMRASYAELFSCKRARVALLRRKQRYLDNPLGMGGLSTRVCAFAGVPLARLRGGHSAAASFKRRVSTRVRTNSRCAGNFVRNSLQMQSRDFEQLCEFMMRVAPINDSSEGWRESDSSSSSSESEGFWQGRKIRSEGGLLGAVDGAIRRLSGQSLSLSRQPTPQPREPSHSIVLQSLGRTAEQWAKFAKKGSI